MNHSPTQMRYANDFIFKLAGIKHLSVRRPRIRKGPSFPTAQSQRSEAAMNRAVEGLTWDKFHHHHCPVMALEASWSQATAGQNLDQGNDGPAPPILPKLVLQSLKWRCQVCLKGAPTRSTNDRHVRVGGSTLNPDNW